MRRIAPSVALLAAAFVLASAPSHAEPVSGGELKSLVAGKKVYLSTPYGLELPLRYGRDGTVSGDLTGFTMARMFAPRETGRWWVDGPRLCQRWESWYDGKTLCFRITRQGEGAIGWVRDDGLAGSARIEG